MCRKKDNKTHTYDEQQKQKKIYVKNASSVPFVRIVLRKRREKKKKEKSEYKRSMLVII